MSASKAFFRGEGDEIGLNPISDFNEGKAFGVRIVLPTRLDLRRRGVIERCRLRGEAGGWR